MTDYPRSQFADHARKLAALPGDRRASRRPGVLDDQSGAVDRLRVELGDLVALALLGGPAAAESGTTTTLTFKEPEKGSTFGFVDNAPKSELKHGFPTSFSIGDELIFTNPLVSKGKTVGRVRVVCTATQNASSESFSAAAFICTGLAKIPGGTLTFATELSEGKTEGTITGGTGRYAGAQGTFVGNEGKGTANLTITLLG